MTATDGAPNQIVVPGRGTAADPTTSGASGGGALLEVYNATGSGEKVTVALPALGWTAYDDRPTPRGYRYRSAATTDPITRVVVKGNRLRVRGGRANWLYTLDEPSQGAMALRLTMGTGLRWCARTPARSPSVDRVDRFVGARGNPSPVSCPPVP